MNILGATKAVVPLVVSMGVGTIISNAVKATTPVDVKLYQKITIAVGSVALSSLVGDVASRHATEQIDKTAQQYHDLKKSIRDSKQS